MSTELVAPTLYLVAVAFEPLEEPTRYLFTVYVDGDRPINDGERPIFVSDVSLIDDALAFEHDPLVVGGGPAPRLLYATYQIDEARRLLDQAEWDDSATIINVLNLLVDVVGGPSKIRSTVPSIGDCLFPLCDHLTFSRDIAAYFQDSDCSHDAVMTMFDRLLQAAVTSIRIIGDPLGSADLPPRIPELVPDNAYSDRDLDERWPELVFQAPDARPGNAARQEERERAYASMPIWPAMMWTRQSVFGRSLFGSPFLVSRYGSEDFGVRQHVEYETQRGAVFRPVIQVERLVRLSEDDGSSLLWLPRRVRTITRPDIPRHAAVSVSDLENVMLDLPSMLTGVTSPL